nr:carboxypeptidase-like regulatory domain-containing protein [Gemmatimonadaceae bacterium]
MSLPLAIVAALLLGQPGDSTGVLRGRVVDAASGAGVQAVTVSVVGTLTGAYTDAEGRFLVARVPAGQRVVRARLLGWRNTEQ